jgi:3-methyladenine DNA glycosylase AlkD
LGVSNPDIHKLARKYKNEISKEDTLYFLTHEIHEYRLFALDILKYKYEKGNDKEKEKIVNIYLGNRNHINNWDLVDSSAPNILGKWFLDKDRDILYQLLDEDNLWSKRIAILSTFTFIKHEDYKDTLKISKQLLSHKHDLIHKAVGWMLREIWKRDSKTAEDFIKQNYKNIPRTTLRYAIERMEEDKRKKFLRGEI